EGMSHFVTHHHSHFVIRQLQPFQDAKEKSDFASRHAERIDLLRADHVHFPLPVFCFLIPLCCMWNYPMRNSLQTDDLRMILRRERPLCLCRSQQAVVLLQRVGFQHSFRYEPARNRGATDYDAFVYVSGEAISNESQ